MNPAELVRIFDRYKEHSGIVGVALGPKEVKGRTDKNPLAVSFFVRKKLPVKGARRRLADGRVRLPKFVELQGDETPTDVVTTDVGHADAGRSRATQVFRAGGPVSNLQSTGTFGCIVTKRDQPGQFALTNRHVALDPGTVLAFPNFEHSNAIAGVTSTSVGKVEDERFLALFDAPRSYIDVDGALVQIPLGLENRFSPDIPHFGAPVGIFEPDGADQTSYVNSLVGREVFSYSWKSGPRTGTISHVYYVYQRTSQGVQTIACFTVKSSDDEPPGILGDSGKVWLTRDNDKTLCVGLHMGVVADSPTSSRFAMVTEFASLARFLNIDVV